MPGCSRVGRGIRLTEAGATFLVEARAVLAQVDRAELVLAEISGLRRGRLILQASETIASYWLPPRLVAFRQRNPGLTIRLAIGNSAEAVEAVVAGRAEIGFVEGAVDNTALVVTELAQDRLIVVVAPGHPWAGRAEIAATETPGMAWVLREPGSERGPSPRRRLPPRPRSRSGAGAAARLGGDLGGAGDPGACRCLPPAAPAERSRPCHATCKA